MTVTTVISKIGVGGDFTTWAAWWAAAPANFTLNESSTTGVGSTTSTVQLNAAASATAGAYVGNTLLIGGEMRLIKAYDATTKVATVGALNGSAATFTSTPATGVAYTIDQVIWRGEQLDQELSISSSLTLSGKIVSATCYAEMTAAAGASIFDKAQGPLRYDGTRGAALKHTGGSNACLVITQQYTRVSRLQFATSSAAVTGGAISITGVSPNVNDIDIDRCICESGTTSASISVVVIRGQNSRVRNSAIVYTGSTAAASMLSTVAFGSAYNCTLVSINSKPTVGIKSQYETGTLRNMGVFNAVAPFDGATAMTVSGCYSDVTMTGFAFAPYSTATFESVTAGSLDLRLKAGAALQNAGVADTTYAATDIYGTARPQGASYDVGAYELQVVDTTEPTLTTPTSLSTGTSSGSGSVTTDKSGGTLYSLASVNATETAAVVKAGASKAVTAAGVQSVTASSLNPSTAYRFHFLHQGSNNIDSSVVSSAVFTTAALGDTTKPVLEVPTAVATSSTTASGTVATDEAGGALYRMISTSPTATAAAVKDANLTSSVEATGTQNVLFVGLPPATTLYPHYLQVDGSGNESLVASGSAFATPAAPAGTGTFKTKKLSNNTSTGLPANTPVSWSWHQNGRIGAAATSITYGSGVLASDGTLTITNCPVGPGYLLACVRAASYMTDAPYYQPGTVA